jgi:hypothetical protein
MVPDHIGARNDSFEAVALPQREAAHNLVRWPMPSHLDRQAVRARLILSDARFQFPAAKAKSPPRQQGEQPDA